MLISFTRFTKVFLAVSVLPIHFAQAGETKVEVLNCSDSHHEVKAKLVTSDDKAVTSGLKSVHSGSSHEISCDSSDCDVLFLESGGEYHWEQDAKNGDKYYTHVKKSHRFSVTSDGSNCGSSD